MVSPGRTAWKLCPATGASVGTSYLCDEGEDVVAGDSCLEGAVMGKSMGAMEVSAGEWNGGISAPAFLR